jgi:hypothetical protein
MAKQSHKTLAEKLIKSVEETYFDLRKKHADKDEHWFLANTWLARYGAQEEAKQKGEDWANFAAYKETHEFAILEPPQSIRGLALLMVVKEFGEKQAKHYEVEFFKIIEPVVQSKKEHVFLEEYQKRNPITWQEIKARDDTNYSLYWFFRGMELELEREEVPTDEFGEFDIIAQLEAEDKQLEQEGEVTE